MPLTIKQHIGVPSYDYQTDYPLLAWATVRGGSHKIMDILASPSGSVGAAADLPALSPDV